MDQSSETINKGQLETASEKRKESKLTKEALREKLKELDRLRNIRLAKEQQDSCNKETTETVAPLPVPERERSLARLLSSGSSNFSERTTVILTEGLDDLSELNSDYDEVSYYKAADLNPVNIRMNIIPSISEYSQSSTPSGESEYEAPDRDIVLFKPSNDHSYAKTNDDCVTSEASNIESSESSKTEDGTSQQKVESSKVQSGESSEVETNVKPQQYAEVPTTPESRHDIDVFEPDDTLNKIVDAILDERIKEISIFGELCKLRATHFENSKNKLRTTDDVNKLFHKLFRFNMKCEENMETFHYHLVKDYKSLVTQFNLPGSIFDINHATSDSERDTDLIDEINAQHLGKHKEHIFEARVILERFDDAKSALKLNKNHDGSSRELKVVLERCDNLIPRPVDAESKSRDTDEEIDSLTNLASLNRKRKFRCISSCESESSEEPAKKSKPSPEPLQPDDIFNHDSNSTFVSITPTNEDEFDEIHSELDINNYALRQILDAPSCSTESDDSDNKQQITSVITKEEEIKNDDVKMEQNDHSIKDEDTDDDETEDDSETDSSEESSDEEPAIKPSQIKLEALLDRSIDSSDSDESSPIKDLLARARARKDRARKYNTTESCVVESSDTEEIEAKGRKNIREIIDDDQLDANTLQANREEQKRLERLNRRTQDLSQVSDEFLDEFVLDYDPDTKKSLVIVHPRIDKYLKPHQREGIRFMWDNCYESVRMIEKEGYKGSGCILAHCMGLGKTLQVIALSHTLMQNPRCQTKTALVVCPRSVVPNWAEEIAKWLSPFPKDQKRVFDFGKVTDLKGRAAILKDWRMKGGVMLMSYEMYRFVCVRLEKKDPGMQVFAQSFARALRDPGPDVVFLDEGHVLKNQKTVVRKHLEEIRTRRRIILTGTPMQNNLMEYYWMVHYVKPNLLGSVREYGNRFANPIRNGQHKDSKERDIKLMKKRSHVLHKLLEGTVQRKEVTILREYLPRKYEYVLLLNPTPVQERLYNHYLREFAQTVEDGAERQKRHFAARFFADYQAVKRIWTHPYALYDLWKQESQAPPKKYSGVLLRKLLDEARELVGEGSAATSSNSSPFDDADLLAIEQDHPGVPRDWWRAKATDQDLNTISASGKLAVMFDILERCSAQGEKLLVFSSSLNVLNTIEHFLATMSKVTRANREYRDGAAEGDWDAVGRGEVEDHPVVGTHRGIWTAGVDYFRFDGKLEPESRLNYCRRFNDPSNKRGRLFLVSTKAGGIGLNMTGANRVIILDVSWNPAVDTQSIFRAYRLQQTRTVYVYRMIASGLMEQKIYERSVTKQAVSCRVVDEQQIDRHYTMNDLAELYVLYKQPEPKPMPRIPEDELLADLLTRSKNWVYSYHEHDSLLMNLEDEVLDSEEQRLAWDEFMREKEMMANPNLMVNHNLFGNMYTDFTGIPMPGAPFQQQHPDHVSYDCDDPQMIHDDDDPVQGLPISIGGPLPSGFKQSITMTYPRRVQPSLTGASGQQNIVANRGYGYAPRPFGGGAGGSSGGIIDVDAVPSRSTMIQNFGDIIDVDAIDTSRNYLSNNVIDLSSEAADTSTVTDLDISTATVNFGAPMASSSMINNTNVNSPIVVAPSKAIETNPYSMINHRRDPDLVCFCPEKDKVMEQGGAKNDDVLKSPPIQDKIYSWLGVERPQTAKVSSHPVPKITTGSGNTKPVDDTAARAPILNSQNITDMDSIYPMKTTNSTNTIQLSKTNRVESERPTETTDTMTGHTYNSIPMDTDDSTIDGDCEVTAITLSINGDGDISVDPIREEITVPTRDRISSGRSSARSSDSPYSESGRSSMHKLKIRKPEAINKDYDESHDSGNSPSPCPADDPQSVSAVTSILKLAVDRLRKETEQEPRIPSPRDCPRPSSRGSENHVATNDGTIDEVSTHRDGPTVTNKDAEDVNEQQSSRDEGVPITATTTEPMIVDDNLIDEMLASYTRDVEERMSQTVRRDVDSVIQELLDS